MILDRYLKFLQEAHKTNHVQITIGKMTANVEIAKTPDQIYTGLSNRSELNDQGMLFLMPNQEVHSFCMRGMNQPLDFIWINNGRVVGATPNISPTFSENITSPTQVSQVLELPAGFVDKYGIKKGDKVILN